MATKRKSKYTPDQFVASDDDSQFGRPAKRTKAPSNAFPSTTEPEVDGDGNKYWEISKARRVTVSEFKGKSMVNIREYYQKDGDWLPGKKGISMTVEQYSSFIAIIPQIEILLQKKGESVPRPDYSGPSKPQAIGDETKGGEDDDPKKSNIEATSEEED